MLSEALMIEFIEHGEIHELRLNRPPVNALSPELLAAIGEGVRRAPKEGARAVVLSGSPGVFSGGLDVPCLLALDRQDLAAALEVFFGVVETLARSEVPVVAAITGHSPAGGAVLALACDWRVMADGDFKIGLNEVRIGIPIPAIVASLVQRAVGARRAEDLCVTGRLLDPAEALKTGLVDEVVAPVRVVEAARSWCEQVVSVPSSALAETRTRMRADLVEMIERHRERDARRLAQAWFEPELQAAMKQLVARLKGK
jgi:enoyl-CoA hydratase/carnithine racemase